MTYDQAGRLTSKTDRDGRRIDYSYDAAGNLTGQSWYDANGTLVQTESWAYDQAGRLLSASNSAGSYTFQYDAAGHVSHVDEPFGVSLDFGYDLAGNRTSVTDSLGGSETSTYDGNLLVSRVLIQSGLTMREDFRYDLAGNAISETRYSDAAGTTVVASTTLAYDGANRLTSEVDNALGGAQLASFTFSYDTAGRLTSQDDNGQASNYGYDQQGQLTSDGSSSHSYDAAGNPTGPGFVIGAGNQLLSDGTWNYSYDAEGNLASKTSISTGEVWTYSYDNANQMTSAAHQASAGLHVDLLVTFTYDVFGNLIQKDTDADGDGPGAPVTTRYAWDGWKSGGLADPVGNENWDVWADLDGNDNLQTRYLHTNGVDDLVGRVAPGSGVFWTLTDYQGSIRLVLDGAGTVLDSVRYDGFGNIVSETAAPSRGDYAYTGRLFVMEVGLQYNRARWYDPEANRWTTQDPEGIGSGDFNWYRYDGNGPTNATDPSGDYLFAADDNIRRAWESYLQKKFGVTTNSAAVGASGIWWIRIPVKESATFYQGLARDPNKDRAAMLRKAQEQGLGYNVLLTGPPDARNSWRPLSLYESTEQDVASRRAEYGEGPWVSPPQVMRPHSAELSPVAEGAKGLGHGGVIVANQLTAQAIPALDSQAQQLIRDNGYEAANNFAGAGATILHIVGPGKAFQVGGKIFKAEKVVAVATKAAPVLHVASLTAQGVRAYGRVADLLRQGKIKEAQEQAIKEAVWLMLGPQARQRTEAALELKKALDAKEWGRAKELAKRQLLVEVNHAVDNLDACKIGGVPGDALRVRQAILGARAARDFVGAVQRGDWETARLKGQEAVQRLEQLDRPCFVAGTLVLAREGYKPIEQLRKGDWVASSPEDDPSGPVEWRQVEEVYVNQAAVVWVQAEGQRIGTTAPHGFGVEGKGWVPVGELRAGDVLRSHDGQRPVVEGVSGPGDVVPVYNLKVKGYHTYFVGHPDWGFSVWVHNGNGDDCDPTALAREADKLSKEKADTTAFRKRIVLSRFHAQTANGPDKKLFESAGIKLDRKLDLATPSDSTNPKRSNITYVFRDKQTQAVVYVGRASGVGNPNTVLVDRLNKPHKRYNPAIHDASIIDVHSSELAGQGAEEVYILGFRELGPLINDDPALSYLNRERAAKSLNKLDAFFKEVAARQ